MRAVNRVLSLLLGLVLLAGGLLVVVEAVLAAIGQDSWLVPADRWYEALTDTRLGDRVVLLTALAVGLLGVVILVVELRRWRPDRLPVQVDAAEGHWWVQRRGAERRLAAAAEEVSGVVGAQARVSSRGGPWRVKLRAEAREDSREAVAQSAREALERLGAPPGSSVRLRVAEPKRVT